MAESHGGDAKGQQTGAHTEADGGHGGAFPPFDSSTFASQLVSLLIAFVALYLIVSKIALPRVGSVLDARQNAIEGDLAKAQELKDASDAALKAYENELAAARPPRPNARPWKGASRSSSPRRKNPSPPRARRRCATSAASPRRRPPRSCSGLPAWLPTASRWKAP